MIQTVGLDSMESITNILKILYVTVKPDPSLNHVSLRLL